ncbi:D-inositol-3-phosphate glycosyltransferase [compost metagenome]
MRIVIDLQGLQAKFPAACNEQIELVRSFARQASEHELMVVLSGQYVSTILPIRQTIADLIGPKSVKVWFAPPVLTSEPDKPDAVCSKLIHQAFLANLLPDLLVLSDLSLDCEALCNSSGITQKNPHLALICGPAVRSALSTKIKEVDYFDLFLIPKDEDIRALLEESVKEECIVRFEQISGAQNSLQKTLDKLGNSTAKKASDPVCLEKIQKRKPRLAYVSPLPPARSGIADYSAELIPFLADYYDIDVVTDQAKTSEKWILKNCRRLSISEFEKSGHEYDRILYHFGNNPMHIHMCNLLEKFPGTVVLHDFYLGDLQWNREALHPEKLQFWNELYISHGYKAVAARFNHGDEETITKYPSNFSIIQKALGVIVHSENSVRLANQYYGHQESFSVVPLLRRPNKKIDKTAARKLLGFKRDDFVVCSFGFLGKTKQNHRLLNAWNSSEPLSTDQNCKLVFVGGEDGSPYGREIVEEIRHTHKLGNIVISGWTDAERYRLYLMAADAAVQLRALSRGETSAAALDCLNYGIATIINANGSLADIPDEVVIKIPDEFSDSELRAALENLHADTGKRKNLGIAAKDYVQKVHSPERCAMDYTCSIESFYRSKPFASRSLISMLASQLQSSNDESSLIELAKALALNFPRTSPSRTLFLDVSAVARTDLKTGIQRVVRALTLGLIESPPEGYRIEPVYLVEENGEWFYRYARDYTLNLLGVKRRWIRDERMEAKPGDTLLGLDLAGVYVILADKCGVYRDLRNRGINVAFVVYDLLPVHFEKFFPSGVKEGHSNWLEVVANADSAICISKAVADEMVAWVTKHVPERRLVLDIKSFHLGADLDTSSPSTGLPEDAPEVLQQLSNSPSFLMVGTVEPRKAHEQTLDAFDRLWSQGSNLNLVVVGKEGWMVDALAARFRKHPELGKRLHWLEGISDEYLKRVYAISSCLLATSEGEGFGLPLIEAAQQGLPIIARDIPVFREVAGEHAFYFKGSAAEDLSNAISAWIDLYKRDSHPKSTEMPWLTWKQSTEQLKAALLNSHPVVETKDRNALPFTEKGTSA